MKFVAFNILLLFFSVFQTNQIDSKEALKNCISNDQFIQFIVQNPYEQHCKQLIIVKNEYLSEEDSIIYNNQNVLFKTNEEVFENSSPKTVLTIEKVSIENDKAIIYYDLSKSKITDSISITSFVLTKVIMNFQVIMEKKNGDWSLVSIE